MTDLSEQIQKHLLPHVEKPLRYAGGELNAVRKELGGVTVHGVCCFPDLYDLGMSHHGLQILYHIVNGNERWAMSRCYHPWTDAEAAMRSAEIPLFTLEYFSPVKQADWIGFSVQYELQYTNIVNMIDLAGLPILASERHDSDPVIIAGGPCMNNPEPLAQFIDAFLIGDGEEAVVEFCSVIEKFKGAGRAKILEEVAKIRGFYVPSLYKCIDTGTFVVPDVADRPVIKPARIKKFDAAHIPKCQIVPLMEVVHHRFAAEVMRGCTRGCRFCSAGMYYRPVREKDVADVSEQITDGVRATGWRDVGLLSLSTADYSGIAPLLASLRTIKQERRLKMSLPSTRIDALTREQLDELNAVAPITSFTIAPEAASPRLRKVINKDFTDEAIYNTVQLLLERNAQTIKLYFMIGLPTETQEDILAIIEMVRTISAMMRKKSPRLSLNVSLSPFSPKPNTPFQWEGMESVEMLEDKGRFIKKCLRDSNKNVKVSYRDGRMTFLETVMARGDRRIGDVVLAAWRAGARFDGWDEKFDLGRWMEAARSVGSAGVDLGRYVSNIDMAEILPWSAISVGVDVEFLKRERDKAYAGEVTEDCRSGECSGCGACEAVRSVFYGDGGKPPVTPPPKTDNAKNHNLNQLCSPGGNNFNITSTSKDTSTDIFGRRARSVPDSKSGGAHRYRVYFEKHESVRFLGHLDMVAVFHRAMAAAGIPLAYSQGFNPHPRVSFGPPLPFGAVGMNEAFDIETQSIYNDDPLDINKWLPAGLRVKSHCKITDKASLTASVTAARYRIFPPRELSVDEMKTMLDERVVGKTEIIISREKNGKVTAKNIRPAITGASVGVDGDSGKHYWEVTLSLVSGTTCKPSEFISTICPNEDVGAFEIARMGYIIAVN